MTRPLDDKGAYDRDLERLFSTFDGIKASEELKNATLLSIFAQMDEEEEPAGIDAADQGRHEAKKGGPEPNEARTSRDALRMVEAVEPDVEVYGEPDVVVDVEPDAKRLKASPKRHAGRFLLRVAAVAAVVLVGIVGGLSFVLPVSRVHVLVDDMAFDLNVNVYGTTVSATASSGGGSGTLAKAKVQNVALDDAVTNLMDACKEGGTPVDVSVSVYDSIGGDNPKRAKELRDKAKKELGAADATDMRGAEVAQAEDERRKQEATDPVEPNAHEPSSAVEPNDPASQGEGMPQEQVAEPAQPADPVMQEVAQDNGAAMPQDAGRPEGAVDAQAPVDNRMDQPVASEDRSWQGGDGIQILDQSPSQPAPQGFGQGSAEPVIEL